MNRRIQFASAEDALLSLSKDLEHYVKAQQPLPLWLQIEIDALDDAEQEVVFDYARRRREDELRQLNLSKTNVSALSRTMGIIRRPNVRQAFLAFWRQLWS